MEVSLSDGAAFRRAKRGGRGLAFVRRWKGVGGFLSAEESLSPEMESVALGPVLGGCSDVDGLRLDFLGPRHMRRR
jgi:hypothetical protein